MDERAEYISIAEAATLLGVHRNTVRNRVKAGRYKAHKVVTAQGETYAILRESLGLPRPIPTNEAAQPLVSPVRDNPNNPSQPTALVSPDQQAQADAIVQRLLAPFIAELGEVREELGRTKAQSEAKDETIAELRRRAEAAEAALVRRREAEARAGELVRRRNEQEWLNRERMQAAQDGSGTPEPLTPDNPSAESSQGFWARVRRVFGGE